MWFITLLSVFRVETLEEDFYVFINDEPFGLGRFATDRCYVPQVNGRYAALLPTLSIM